MMDSMPFTAGKSLSFTNNVPLIDTTNMLSFDRRKSKEKKGNPHVAALLEKISFIIWCCFVAFVWYSIIAFCGLRQRKKVAVLRTAGGSIAEFGAFEVLLSSVDPFEFGYALNGLICKSALNKGMNPYTFAVYRNVIAAIVFGPFAWYFERKIRPTMTFSIFIKIMLLGLLEPVIDQVLYYTGMKYTTATFAIAMCNILPAITFIMAWIFRLEKVNISRLHSQGKILGTVITVGGAMVMTLVKGPTIGFPWSHEQGLSSQSTSDANPHDHIKGAIMITAGCFCWAAFYILQAITMKTYPAQLSLTTLICMMGALQGTVLTVLVEKGKTSIWAVSWDTKLIATLYSGIVRSGASYYVSGVVMNIKGPFFVTAFNPLGMIIVAVMGSFTLGEQMDFGRLLGAAVIVLGLYLVIWGKSKDSSLSKSENNEVDSIDQQMTIMDDDSIITNHDHVIVPGKVPSDEAV